MENVNKVKSGNKINEPLPGFARLGLEELTLIANKVGCHYDYVLKVLKGERNRNTTKAKRIYAIGKLMLEQIKRTESLLLAASIEQFDMD